MEVEAIVVGGKAYPLSFREIGCELVLFSEIGISLVKALTCMKGCSRECRYKSNGNGGKKLE